MNFRERIEQRRGIQDNQVPANDNEQEQEIIQSEYFGIENLRNAPACVDLRMKDGRRKALPYSYIMEINFDAGVGIEIITSSKQIKIIGRDLGKLYDYLIVYRVRFIQESVGTDVEENGLFVKEIILNDT